MIRAGDIFFTTSPSALSRLINWGQGLKSEDRRSTYSHCGVCTGGLNTFESLATIRTDDLLKYVGQPFMLVRPRRMDEYAYIKGMRNVIDMNGAIYPFHRLFLILGGLGRVSIRNWLVCSELVAKFLMYAGIRTNCDYCGTTVDNLADEVHNVPFEFDILFEGTLTRKELSYANMVNDDTRDINVDSVNISQGRSRQPLGATITGASDVHAADAALSNDDGQRQGQRQFNASNANADANGRAKSCYRHGHDAPTDSADSGADERNAGDDGGVKKNEVAHIEDLRPSD